MISRSRRDSVGGGSSRSFPWSPNLSHISGGRGGGVGQSFPGQKPSIRFRARAQNTARVHSETHISQDPAEKELFFAEN